MISCSVAFLRLAGRSWKETEQTEQAGFGLLSFSVVKTRSADLERKIVRASERVDFMTLKACRTQRPAVMALVVAMAGMMLPAICLMSNFDLMSMPKTWLRRL